MMNLARVTGVQRSAATIAARAKFSSQKLTFDQHPFLARLGLEEENMGCWNGKEWVGNGDMYTSMNPSTGEPVARIKFGNSADYNDCINNMHEVSCFTISLFF